ncbi:hypothetical protein KAM353_09540 [Aeromonas caviae]|nr:hypothetical protein KAM353_09540 [Aeromonas caviae]GKR42817.1 hypothetical protein KAM473_03360 [Aeromonas caviae]
MIEAKTFPNHSFYTVAPDGTLERLFGHGKAKTGVFEGVGASKKRNLRRSGPDRLGENAFEVFGS